jgi:hypothetical protein
MNHNINRSGQYDVTLNNLTTNNATIFSTLNVGGVIIGPDQQKKLKILKNKEKEYQLKNIGAIVGNIGAAALTGGVAAADEALILGGTSGLLSSGEAILGASLGRG